MVDRVPSAAGRQGFRIINRPHAAPRSLHHIDAETLTCLLQWQEDRGDRGSVLAMSADPAGTAGTLRPLMRERGRLLLCRIPSDTGAGPESSDLRSELLGSRLAYVHPAGDYGRAVVGLGAAHAMLGEDGLIAVHGIRDPGVGAAVWGLAARRKFHLIGVGRALAFAALGDPRPAQETLMLRLPIELGPITVGNIFDRDFLTIGPAV